MKLAQAHGGRTPLVRIALTQEVATRVADVLAAANTDGLKLVGSTEAEITTALDALRTALGGSKAPKVSPLKGRKTGPRKAKTEDAPPSTGKGRRKAAAPAEEADTPTTDAPFEA